METYEAVLREVYSSSYEVSLRLGDDDYVTIEVCQKPCSRKFTLGFAVRDRTPEAYLRTRDEYDLSVRTVEAVGLFDTIRRLLQGLGYCFEAASANAEYFTGEVVRTNILFSESSHG